MKLLTSLFLSLLVQVCLFGQSFSYVAGVSTSTLAVESFEINDDAAQLIRKQGLLLVEGEVDGRVGYLIVDTGSPGLILNQALDSTALTAQFEGATGQAFYQDITVGRLEVGGLRQNSLKALRADMSYTADQLGVNLLGIIGHQQLSAAPVLVQLSQNQLRFNSAQLPNDADKSNSYPFKLQGHLPVLTANVGDTSFELAFDSGSSVNLIDASYLSSISGSFRGRPATRVLSGLDANPVSVPCALVKMTLLDDEPFHNKSFLFVDLTRVIEGGESFAGLLSPSFWSGVDFAIDYQTKTLTIFGK